MSMSQNVEDNKIAGRILNILSDHHLFLVTLLIGNAIVLESLPLVIHKIMPDWAAILFSTFIVLIVAEIVPMSYSTGKHKINIAYRGTPLVLIMMKIFYILAYPIAQGLDKLLGHHSK
jgi:metal transporter CNNM